MLKKLLKVKKDWIQGMKNYQVRDDAEVLVMCRKCYAFKYENGWHFERPSYLIEKDADEKISVKFSQCPACIEEALAVYDMEYV